MRCLSCNEILSDFEATRKSVNTNQFIDLCNRCYHTVDDDILSLERGDLEHEETVDVDYDLIDSMDIDLDNRDPL
jgi:hypothetical protein